MNELIKEFREMKINLLNATKAMVESSSSKSNTSGAVTSNMGIRRGAITCFYCKQEGHKKYDCPVLKSEEKANSAQETGKDRARH
jgi:hypothetical protein